MSSKLCNFFSYFLIFLIGGCASLIGVAVFHQIPFELEALLFIIILSILFFVVLLVAKKRVGHDEKLDIFKKETLLVFRGFLKISTLFWIHYTKKEKVKSLEETKKEIFKDLKKEFSKIAWMEEIINVVKQDINRYEKP